MKKIIVAVGLMAAVSVSFADVISDCGKGMHDLGGIKKGMSLNSFEKKYPDAVKISVNAEEEVFYISEHNVCTKSDDQFNSSSDITHKYYFCFYEGVLQKFSFQKKCISHKKRKTSKKN